MKKILSIILCLSLLACLLTACGGSGSSGGQGGTANDGTLTIRVFSNLTDRTSGQGLIEQMLFDQYTAETGIKIEYEALADADYQTKFKAYSTGSGMPDLVNIWAMPSFLDEVVANGILAELNPNDYADYGFADGSLSGTTYNGKLYGLTRNTDELGFFYNKDMFAQYGVSVPTTWDELLSACQTLKDNGVIPISLDGQDGWVINHFFVCMAGSVWGADSYDKMVGSVQNKDYSDPVWNEVITAAVDNAGLLFQPGFETTDYDTALNMFKNKQTAMLFMGSWEMGMSAEFEIGHFPMPDFNGDGVNYIGAYNGGGYGVYANSANKEEAIKLLNYMFKPENWTKLCWENGICMSAQDFSSYLTGNETDLQKDVINDLNSAPGITGMPYNDCGSAEYKTICENGATAVLAGSISVQDYLNQLASVS